MRAVTATKPSFLLHRRDVAAVALVLPLLPLQLLVIFEIVPWYLCLVPIIVVRWTVLVQHNLSHGPIFRSPVLDDAFGLLLFTQSGIPIDFYRIGHARNHHRHNCGPDDWTSPFNFRDAHYPDRPTSKLRYVLTFGWRLHSKCWALTVHTLGQPQSRRVIVHSVLVHGMVVALLVVSPTRAALAILGNWLLIAIGAPLANWKHHIGCTFVDAESSSNDSRTWWSRGFGFNIGYHTAHHVHPRAHWTELPLLDAHR